jgi:ribonuclease BN (tRNA processing enzyme)
MELSVLGASPAWANPGEACSSHLVHTEDERLVLDLGNGALARLRRLGSPAPRAIVLSHLHPDHFADLVPLAYGLRHGDWGWPRPSLHVPAGGLEVLDRLARVWGSDLGMFGSVLDLAEYRVDTPFTLGSAVVLAAPADHSGLPHCLRVEIGGRVLGYTGDTAYDAGVAAHLRGSHVLLAEATTLEGDAPGGPHQSAADAARMALAADAGRLLLTHVPQERRARALREARRAFPRTALALPGLRVDV